MVAHRSFICVHDFRQSTSCNPNSSAYSAFRYLRSMRKCKCVVNFIVNGNSICSCIHASAQWHTRVGTCIIQLSRCLSNWIVCFLLISRSSCSQCWTQLENVIRSTIHRKLVSNCLLFIVVLRTYENAGELVNLYTGKIPTNRFLICMKLYDEASVINNNKIMLVEAAAKLDLGQFLRTANLGIHGIQMWLDNFHWTVTLVRLMRPAASWLPVQQSALHDDFIFIFKSIIKINENCLNLIEAKTEKWNTLAECD